ncbi:MAG: hypothetical protein Q8834_02660, partial [Candidatus Phytoplasma australasiaticum]|nr:hypothetical protein [Candidatus Phytoplasma australasiaticum]
AIPTYMMSVFPVPENVIQRIDALRRNFLWQGLEDKKKFHLIKWEEVLISRKEGGMGVRNMRKQNRSLMLKWLWKFMTGDNMLWEEVAKAKYEMESNWMTKMVSTPYGCGLWRSVRNLWPLILFRIRFKVGNGMKVLFWEDIWIAQRPLKQIFPELFSLSLQPRATIFDLWTGQGWNLNLRRNLNDWELADIEAFHNTMAGFSNMNAEEDRVIWQLGNKENFSVKAAYSSLNHSRSRLKPWPWKMILKTRIPYKVNCFTWLLAREVVLTQENLKKRKFQMTSRCYLCEEQLETVKPSFFAL